MGSNQIGIKFRSQLGSGVRAAQAKACHVLIQEQEAGDTKNGRGRKSGLTKRGVGKRAGVDSQC